MKISSLLENKQQLLEQHMVRSQMILNESCVGLDRTQRAIVEGIYQEFKPLIEASLTTDQIKQLFGQIEKASIAAGGSRTVAGKGVDVVKKANEIINNAGKWLQNTKPVQNFDAKFEQLKDTINKKFPDSKILDGISKMGMWAQENPGKTAAIVGILTAIASLAAGPVGGAIAGQVLRGSVELLKGEKLSTAIGKGVKTAAFGFIAGKAFELLGDYLGGLRADVVMKGEYADASWDATKTIRAPGFEWTQQIRGVNVKVLPDDARTINFLMGQLDQGGSEAVQAFDKLARLAADIRSPDYKQMLADVGAAARDNDSLYNWIMGAKEGLQAASQGAVTAAGTAKSAKESYYLQQRPLSEGQVYLIFNKIQQLNEGPLDAVRKGASWIGKQATEKITSAKLLAAWKMAGSPTDSSELADFLEKQGVGKDIVDQTFADMKISNAPAAADIETVKALIAKLPTERKVRLLKYMTKQVA
jgi:hypothetical protein